MSFSILESAQIVEQERVKGRNDKSLDLIREKMQLNNFSEVRKLEYVHLIWSLRKIV